MKIKNIRLIKKCWEVAQMAADSSGFVTLRRLLEASGCELIVRPMLVEAAITTRSDNVDQWVVLLNEEIHKFSSEDLELESHLSPLSVRTRNTVAHEVAHKIAVELLGVDFAKSGSISDKISEIEREVELVSPLLLLPHRYLSWRFKGVQKGDNPLKGFIAIARQMAVSREVFLTAVRMADRIHKLDFVNLDVLTGAQWGMVEFMGKNKFVTLHQWVFDKFHNQPIHEAHLLLQKRKIEWAIIRVESLEGVMICEAISSSFKDGSASVAFEIEHAPMNKGKRAFYRLSKYSAELMS